MKRREFIALAGGLTILPLAARAQLSAKSWRLGYVGTGGLGNQLFEEFAQKLNTLGYVAGKNIVVSRAIASPEAKAVEAAVTKLLPEIDILVIWGTVGATVVKRLNQSVPTVFLSVGAPVDIGLVQSLSHPGGNMTGVSFEAAIDTYAKRLQMLKEAVPSLERIAVLAAQGDSNVLFAMNSIEQAASEMHVALKTIYVKTADDLPAAFAEIQQSNVGGLIVIAGLLTAENSKTIAELALAKHLPSCHGFREAVVAGGLMSLGPDLFAIARQGAVYVDKIIHGANAADLPVEQPDRYETFINLKTANALGLAIPAYLVAGADKVIE
ncbi:ABC transporter substrate-binding protein [Bradyrhizobium manausense]|uniref:ABC transporter substrate-binding protein n=1 Tax=Bradyrhizobium manausense TaxID=989370 RepID=UPI001BA4C079|nr:ABC transporter substrate-binding protein [Bradyrhizobium manausense]MBR1088628.1 ABC transporter substrate-binding protein [Bradyrhizobium manausense]